MPSKKKPKKPPRRTRRRGTAIWAAAGAAPLALALGLNLPGTSSSAPAPSGPAPIEVAVEDDFVRVTDNAGRVDHSRNFIYVAAPLPPPPPVDQPPGGGQPPATPSGDKNPRKPDTFAQLATVPSRKRCVSRKRGLRVTVRDAAGADVRFARVRINGDPAKRLAVGTRRVITVRGLRGRPDVSVSLWLADGRVVSKTYRYHVCAR